MAGMIEVAKATVTIVPNLSGAQESISSQLAGIGSTAAESAGNSSGKSFAGGIANGLKTGLGAVAGATEFVVSSTASLATGFYNAAVATAEYGDEIDKNSQKLGMSATAYQEWDYVMNLAGTSMADCTTGMKTLTNQIDAALSGNEAAIANFEALGISIDDLGDMSREDAFASVIEGLQGMEDGLDRAALANDLFGKSGQNLTPLFNMTAEETAGLIENAHEYGMIMSDEAVAASADFQDSLTTLKGTVTGLKNNFMGQFLPSITSVTNGLTKLLAGDKSGIDDITSGIKEIVAGLAEMLPELLEVGAGIITTLLEGLVNELPTILTGVAEVFTNIVNQLSTMLPQLVPVIIQAALIIVQAILDNLPTILVAAINIVMAIIQGLTQALPQLIPPIIQAIFLMAETLMDNLDQIISAAIELVVTLALAIIDALPELSDKIPEIITTIVTTLLDHLPEIIEAAFTILMALGDGLIQSIPDLILKLPEIITAIVDKMGEVGTELASAALEWAADMIDSFVDGIEGGLDKVGNGAKKIAGEVKSFLGFSEPEKGPLSNFHTYAPDMIDLFTEGLYEGAGELDDAFEEVLTLPGAETTNNLIMEDSYIMDAAEQDSNITIPVSIGQERLDTIIIKSLKNGTYRRGG